MLKHRMLTAIFLIPIIVWLVLWASPLWFCVFTTIVALWAAFEWAGFFTPLLIKRALYVVLIAGCLYGAFIVPALIIFYVALCSWLCALVLVIRYPAWQSAWQHAVIKILMGIIVIVPCWLALNVVRTFGAHGPVLLLFLLLLIWCADSSAYFFGKKWGRHKLAPYVSPGKTWEGVLGALFATIILAIASAVLAGVIYSDWWLVVGLAVITVIFSMLGDLFESMLKRSAGLKDSGRLFPGHGGLLDRIDSLTAAAPIFALGLLKFIS